MSIPTEWSYFYETNEELVLLLKIECDVFQVGYLIKYERNKFSFKKINSYTIHKDV